MKTQRTRIYTTDDELCSAILAVENTILDYNRRWNQFGDHGSESENLFEKSLASLLVKLKAEFDSRDIGE